MLHRFKQSSIELVRVMGMFIHIVEVMGNYVHADGTSLMPFLYRMD